MNVSVTVDRAFPTGRTDDRLVSSHVEHAGRGVYTGVYEPGHPLADEHGLRQDVVRLVREMGTAGVRYPGGNFLSGYRWEDGVGPKDRRPVRPDRAWQAIETNQFGTDEFLRWAGQAAVTPMLGVNLGTRGIDAACDLLEYVNFPGGTTWADRRVQNGHKAPYGVRTWFLGNEMDGPWQLGSLGAEEYGRKAAQTAHAMRSLDPGLELVLSGSSGREFGNYPGFMTTALDMTYDLVDLVSLHQYYGGQYGWNEYGSGDFLGVSLDLEESIAGTVAACDWVRARHRGKKQIQISLDEWCIWPEIDHERLRWNEVHPWTYAGPLAEGAITFEQFLVGAFYCMTVLRHADRVKILCANLLVNTSGPIHAEAGGPAWRQASYYTCQMLARYGRGTVLRAAVDSPKYDSRRFTDVPFVECVPVWQEEDETLTLFIGNRSETESAVVSCALHGFEDYVPAGHLAFYAEAGHLVNGPEGEQVFPRAETGTFEGRSVRVRPFSWNVILLKRKDETK